MSPARRMSPLYQAVLANASWYKQLFILDQDLAETSRKAGCALCSGALHRAPFRRKPRGIPAGLGEDYCVRCSFCCVVDGCRKRLTPASLRFLGRKVYLAVVAFHLRLWPVLAVGLCRLHAAGGCVPPAGLSASSLPRKRRTEGHRFPAMAWPDHRRRRGDARFLTGFANPQKTLMASRPAPPRPVRRRPGPGGRRAQT